MNEKPTHEEINAVRSLVGLPPKSKPQQAAQSPALTLDGGPVYTGALALKSQPPRNGLALSADKLEKIQRRNELLKMQGIDLDKVKISPALQKVIEHHVASTEHPASNFRYTRAEAAIRDACTQEDDRGNKKLDANQYIKARHEYCDRVGYEM